MSSLTPPHLGRRWLQKRGRPIVLGHRGNSAHHPENTLRAFTAALAEGADGVELDVRLTACRTLVVFHDDDLNRLCGDPRRVHDLSFAELSTMRVGGEPIPTLEAVLRELPEALLNIELKPHPLSQALELVRVCISMVQESRALSRVLLSSFDPRLLLLLRVLEPNLPRGLLSAEEQVLFLRRGWSAPVLGVCAVHPEETLVTPSFVRRAHARGKRVHTWTVDQEERIAYLVEAGVDALITNDPGRTLRALSSSH